MPVKARIASHVLDQLMYALFLGRCIRDDKADSVILYKIPGIFCVFYKGDLVVAVIQHLLNDRTFHQVVAYYQNIHRHLYEYYTRFLGFHPSKFFVFMPAVDKRITPCCSYNGRTMGFSGIVSAVKEIKSQS